MVEWRSVHCPQCGTPFDVEIVEDGRLRTLGCVYAKRPGHGELADDAIIAAIEAEHPVYRGVAVPAGAEGAQGPLAARRPAGD